MDWASILIVAVLAARTAWLALQYVLGVPGAARFRVESAAFLFVAAGLLLRLVSRNRPPMTSTPRTASARVPGWSWFGFWLLAIALYWPAVSIGLLSDDFILANHAANWDFAPVTPMLFRPVALFLWAVLLQAGGTAVVLHLLNITLHATNAYLTSRVVEQWVGERSWAILAGLLFLTSPLAPEAVAWCSGVFDVMATTFVLLSVFVARRYDADADTTSRLAFWACSIAAFLSKETAVIGGAIVLVDAAARGGLSKPLLRDVVALSGVVGVFSLVRVAPLLRAGGTSLNWYQVQSAVFGVFGALILPWHVELAGPRPWLPITSSVLALLLTTGLFVLRRPRLPLTVAISAALVILLAVVPVVPLFFVGSDLRGARYAYLPTVGWSGLLAVMAFELRSSLPRLRTLSYAALALVLALDVFGTVMHLRPWVNAAQLRDQIEAAVRAAAAKDCREIGISNLPDEVRGAYVFQNGIREAFQRDMGLVVTRGRSSYGCSLQWKDGTLISLAEP